MRRTLEREVKLDVDGDFTLPDLAGEPLESRVFTSTYHDTPARSLARAGITLRRRLENGLSLWQLKLPREDDARAELEAPGGPAGPPDEIARLLAAHARHGRLEPVATLRTRRSGVRVDGADVTVDAVDILDAGRSAGGFTEVEIELVDGDGAGLERVARRIRKAGARRSDGTPKLFRIVEVSRDEPPPSGAPFSEQLRYLLAAQLHALEAHDPGVRLGDDAEDVHRFRVATRRSRALIRATRPLLGDALAPLAEELRWLAGLLGPVRDLDVLVAHLERQVATLGGDEPAGGELIAALLVQRAACRGRLLEALALPRYTALLTAFERAVASVPATNGDAGKVARDGLRRLRKAGEKLGEPTDDELHALRIKAKRARYAAELAALDGDRATARYVESLKDLQDVIGAHQDAVVAEERLREIARARTAVAAGRLIERERERRRAVRDAWRDAFDRAVRRGEKAVG